LRQQPDFAGLDQVTSGWKGPTEGSTGAEVNPVRSAKD